MLVMYCTQIYSNWILEIPRVYRYGVCSTQLSTVRKCTTLDCQLPMYSYTVKQGCPNHGSRAPRGSLKEVILRALWFSENCLRMGLFTTRKEILMMCLETILLLWRFLKFSKIYQILNIISANLNLAHFWRFLHQ